MEEIKKIADYIFENCINLESEDKILIVTDTNKKNIGQEFLKSALEKNKKSKIIIFEPALIDGEEPPEEVFDEIIKSTLIFELTTCSITHTSGNKIAQSKGAKIISIPAVDEELLSYIKTDYNLIATLCKQIQQILEKTSKILIKTDAGTNLNLEITNQKVISMNGFCNNGEIINLPDGETLVSPINASGILVIDGSMPPDTKSKWGIIGKIKNPIKVFIENNKISWIEGLEEAEIFKNILNEYDDSAKIVAEFAIGTNPCAKIIGNITVDEKAIGTAHIAFGNSTNIGGKNNSPIHLDCVIKNPTIYADNQLIMKEGKLIKTY